MATLTIAFLILILDAERGICTLTKSKVFENPKIKKIFETNSKSMGYQGSESGLGREGALAVIRELKDTDIGILGGDVWQVRVGKLAPAYANWFANPKAGESSRDFATRSRAKAIDYISKFPERRETYYVLVFNQ